MRFNNKNVTLPEPFIYSGLKFTSTGNSTIAMTKAGSAPTVNLQYSLNNGITWNEWDFSAISLSDGQTICFKGNNTQFATNVYGTVSYNKFVMTGSLAASGDIMSILDNGTCTLRTVSQYCFAGLFFGCTSLTTAPQLPATSLANGCYSSMFSGCTSLTTAPELPATTLANSCYYSMFSRCTSLTTAHVLPATTLANKCYIYMFGNCTSLITAPQLPATSLATECYDSMFQGCTSLTTAPELPATSLVTECYSGMFYGCTSLTTAPELPATTLANKCYIYMFGNCTNLNYIKCLATDISATNCTNDWVTNVAATGTFVKDASMSNWATGNNGIPTGWRVQDDVYAGLKFTSTGNSTVALSNSGGNAPDMKYSLDNGNTWTQWDYTAISLTDGQTVCMKGNNPNGFNTSGGVYSHFAMTGSIAASGDVMSLLDDGVCTLRTLSQFGFCSLFYGCTSLTTAPALPATTLANGCYDSMFSGCTSLISAPELPATTLANSCYCCMFIGCINLTTTSELPATTLATGCYDSMFSGCTSLTTAHELPATTLANGCYSSMFAGCTSLITAPELPATTLATNCYDTMFDGCTSLNYIKCLATDISATGCTNNWVSYVSATGIFIKNASMSSWTTGDSGIPSGWTVQDA